MKKISNDGRRYPEFPIVGIGVVVWLANKVLLIKRGNPPRQGEWSLPGGRQHLGETIFEAAIREVREECCIEIMPLGIVTAIDSITKDSADGIEYHYTIIEVAAAAQSAEVKAQDDACDIYWAEIDEIDRLCGWKEIERIVRLSLLQRAL